MTGEEADPVDGSSVRDRITNWFQDHRTGVLRSVASVALLAVAIGTLVVSYQLAGPIATVAYAVLFLLGLTLLPVSILLFGQIVPNSLGTGMFILGQLAFGEGWLVQHDDGWQMHPGRTRDGRSEIYLGGHWHPLDADSKKTVLGWAPFGILLRKTKETMAEARPARQGAGVDLDALDADERVAVETMQDVGVDVGKLGIQQATRSDGGEDVTVVKRGEIEQVQRDYQRRHEWVLDLKRWWSEGLSRMGDIDVVEKIEEVTMRNEAMADANRRRNTYIGVAVGLVLGVLTGMLSMGVF